MSPLLWVIFSFAVTLDSSNNGSDEETSCEESQNCLHQGMTVFISDKSLPDQSLDNNQPGQSDQDSCPSYPTPTLVHFLFKPGTDQWYPQRKSWESLISLFSWCAFIEYIPFFSFIITFSIWFSRWVTRLGSLRYSELGLWPRLWLHHLFSSPCHFSILLKLA